MLDEKDFYGSTPRDLLKMLPYEDGCKRIFLDDGNNLPPFPFFLVFLFI